MLARYRIALFILALMGLPLAAGAEIYMASDTPPEEETTDYAEMETADEPEVLTEAVQYEDKTGAVRILNPAHNRLTVVHFWATWCLPCLREIGDIDMISYMYGDKGLQVLALSLDTTGINTVKQFFKMNQITHLAPVLDTDMTTFRTLRLPGLPGTVFLDGQGREIARASGPLNWNSPKTVSFIEDALTGPVIRSKSKE